MLSLDVFDLVSFISNMYMILIWPIYLGVLLYRNIYGQYGIVPQSQRSTSVKTKQLFS